jgi:hypothetical protein
MKSVLAVAVDNGATSKWKGRQLYTRQPNLPARCVQKEALNWCKNTVASNQQTLCEEKLGSKGFTVLHLVLIL